MRFVFSLVFLTFSLLYTGYGIYSLDLVDSLGRLGPGFFPTMVGALLVITTAINGVGEYRQRHRESAQPGAHGRDVAVTAGLITLFLVLLPVLGSVLTILVFSGIYLYRFNKGQVVFNALYAVVFSVAVFALFEIVLQAGLPRGVLAPLYQSFQ